MKEMTPEDRARAKEAKAEGKKLKLERGETTISKLETELRGEDNRIVSSHLAKAKRGNVRSLIALKCLDCCCWVKAEVRDCEIVECSLHPIRPYQKKG